MDAKMLLSPEVSQKFRTIDHKCKFGVGRPKIVVVEIEVISQFLGLQQKHGPLQASLASAFTLFRLNKRPDTVKLVHHCVTSFQMSESTLPTSGLRA